ncbi:hypothetical protein HKX54_02265 [Sulfitobacter sp. M57]|uniref:hypothetical protein n=1 Tax=unclassified Sulfitobacter TaxID=196795 RepID=UPI0023E306B9|nr:MULTISPECIES: hypothetical protein [unclassified Sulfitobacter]MDF3413266.1 hypothetical protein [Sulfitobacter sp. KE5]MDF3421453.1 hypothetical protein [Sulfitobacter sp. KE43]MDF3431813.1 hypothetical protein [Sulfitobacter sp. KE42]MDF3457453.1 hypothetical protein [Sulfitobacter sp. S74]MDF3461356.1 hypothetical protein [Sulfitobacter sp. Ks18]
MMGEFETLLHSSLSTAGADVIRGQYIGFVSDTLAHIGIISPLTVWIVLRDWPLWLFWVGAALILFKEFYFDMPNGGYAPLVIFDSIWDFATWFFGFFVTWCALMDNVGRRHDA